MHHDQFAHTPVLWREVLDFLSECAEGAGRVFVDCTMGEGGHTELVLEKFPNLSVLGIERDPEVYRIAGKRLELFGERIVMVNDNFANVSRHLERYRGNIAGILYDLGISSYHFDRSGRGFSIKSDEPLDMRLDGDGGRSARDVVNSYSENELTDIFHRYGEERWARKIAAAIRRRCEERPIETTGELAALVLGAIPKRFHVRNIHPATRVFQALRIEVNNELPAISQSLSEAVHFLARGGRMMVISFHSLEDRIVKNRFRKMARGCVCDLEPPHCRCETDPVIRILTKKPVTPRQDECGSNKRARSAKLRVCEKL